MYFGAEPMETAEPMENGGRPMDNGGEPTENGAETLRDCVQPVQHAAKSMPRGVDKMQHGYDTVQHNAEPVQQIALNGALLSQAQALSDEAGWNQTAADWLVFQRHGEIFGVLADGRLVATAAILPYGAALAWISMVLVTAGFRRRGLATGLMRHCMARLQAQGRVALLDATESGEKVYRALGFTTLTHMTRWSGPGGRHTNETPPPLVSLGRAADDEQGKDYSRASSVAADTPPPILGVLRDPNAHGKQVAVRALDTSAFGVDREFLLDDFLARHGAGAWSDGHNAVVLRPGRNAWQIGPLIGTPRRAAGLLSQAIDAATGPVVIDLLEAGEALASELTQRGFTARRNFCRMTFGHTTLPGNPAQLLAAAGPEFG